MGEVIYGAFGAERDRQSITKVTAEIVGATFPSMAVENQQRVTECFVEMFLEMSDREFQWTVQSLDSEQSVRDLLKTVVSDVRRDMVNIVISRINIALCLIGSGLDESPPRK